MTNKNDKNNNKWIIQKWIIQIMYTNNNNNTMNNKICVIQINVIIIIQWIIKYV